MLGVNSVWMTCACAGEYVHGVNSAWMVAERVIAEAGSKRGGDLQYLVKWKDLGYESCT